MMKLEMPGVSTSAEVEITNVSSHGIWILSNNNEEMFLSYDNFPWFKDVPIGKILNVQEPIPNHFYWPELDVDLSKEIIQHPERFPLKAKKYMNFEIGNSELEITNQPLTLESVLDILRKYKKDFSDKYGVTSIGVFGSYARREIKPESDVDIVVRMKKPALFFMVHMKETLEQEYKTKVDIISYRDNMNSFLKKRIDRDAIYV